MTTPMSRRSLLVGFATAVVGGVAGFAVARASGAANGAPIGSAANGYGPPAHAQPKLLAWLSKVPIGGGVVLSSDTVVLTRGSTGPVHAFSAVCTHQGCLVNQVSDGTIDCPCHGSRFNAETGAVVAGPAPRPLPAVAITVRDGGVYRA
jgi:Rieske Fe-S protein